MSAPTPIRQPTGPQASAPAGPWERVWRGWILGALLPVWLLTTFVGTVARVSGDSMNPTLHGGDALLLLKYPRWLRAWGLGAAAYPRRGDVVIFKGPADDPGSYETVWGLRHRPYNIKRVLGLAGDRVEIRGGELLVNGRQQLERYVDYNALQDQPALTVPSGAVWVLGDNRRLGASRDSRDYGPVSLRDLAGPANLRLWPHPGLLPR